MVDLFGHSYSRQDLMRRTGSMGQFGGVRLSELVDGRGKGVSVADFSLGNGFEFTVVPGRSLDVFAARYQGMSLAWQSDVGMAAGAYYEPDGLGWLRTFGGGLLATCGLSFVGAPTVDEGQALGLHGRITNTPAEGIAVKGEWRTSESDVAGQADDYVMSASGTVRESVVFGPSLCLERKVWARLGERRFFIEDTVRNESFRRSPHQMLYHFNLGYPLVDAGSRLVSTSSKATPRDDEAKKGAEDATVFSDPIPGFLEKVYYHEMEADGNGYAWAALVNPLLLQGHPLGLYLKYKKEQLPRFVEWKMMGEGEYVVGMEPSNAGVEGRDKDRANGTLQFLEPWEERRYEIEVGLVVGQDEYRQFRARVG